MHMDENRKPTKYFIRVVNEAPEDPNQEVTLEQLLEENPELKRWAIILMMADKKTLH